MVCGPDFKDAGSGPAIVMFPGAEGSKDFWRFQQEALQSKYRVIACDLAKRKPSLKSGIDDYARDGLRIMDSLGVDRAVVVGESLGGMVTQHLAINYPGRVAAIVLCNTVDSPRRFTGFGLNMFTLATFVHQFAFMPFLTDQQRRAILRWVGKHRGFVMDPTPGNEDLIDYLFAHGTECGFGGYLDRFLSGRTAYYTDRLSEISVPALVLRGTEDRLVPPEAAVQLAGRIRGAQLELIDGGGHCCPHTRPEATNAVITAFLDRIGY